MNITDVQNDNPKLNPPYPLKKCEEILFGFDDTAYRGENPINPPVSKTDSYNWLRDETRKKNELENDYTLDCSRSFGHIQEKLYSEMLGYLKESDEEVPYQHGNYFYYGKTIKDMSYKVHCRFRRTDAGGAAHYNILDENEIASSFNYCDVGDLSPSPSHSILAYSVDTTGYETYTIYFKTLTEEMDGNAVSIATLSDQVSDCTGDVEWGIDDSVVFYTKFDSQHRPYQVWMHKMGTEQSSSDILLFEELDQLFGVGIYKTRSDQFLVIDVESIETTEQYLIPLQSLSQTSHPRLCKIQERYSKVRYHCEHHKYVDDDFDYLYMVTNIHQAFNGKLMRVKLPIDGDISDGTLSADKWEDVIAYDSAIEISSFVPFQNYLVVCGRANSMLKIWTRSAKDLYSNSSLPKSVVSWEEMKFADNVYSVNLSRNYVYNVDFVRLQYSSFVTPKQIIHVNLETSNRTVLKEVEVPGYHKENYVSYRVYAPAVQGAQTHEGKQVMIPISLVFSRKYMEDTYGVDFSSVSGEGGAEGEEANHIHAIRKLHKVPILLEGYGSYGISFDPSFDFRSIPLLDRGIVYAIAHIRGGGEMGRYTWYEAQGKYFSKLNTFYDFCDCANFLVANEITESSKLAAIGGSAGGLLIGASVNLSSNLFKAVVADVPFVDVLNTMSDPSIPLTVGEWLEWGNPNEQAYFDYMSQYCPYSNVAAKEYPNILVTAGLNDPRVAYWEAAKWVAKLREYKTDSNVVMLKTDMSSGHFSASDRYKAIREHAFEMAFVVHQICS